MTNVRLDRMARRIEDLGPSEEEPVVYRVVIGDVVMGEEPEEPVQENQKPARVYVLTFDRMG